MRREHSDERAEPAGRGATLPRSGEEAAVPYVGPGLPPLFHLERTLTRLILGPLRRRFWRRERDLPPPLTGDEVLRRLVALPVSTWSYDYEPGVRHLGPMSQDFAAAFGLGRSNRIVELVDVNGVNVVAIQALARRVVALEKEVAELRASTTGETQAALMATSSDMRTQDADR
jgi:hypothetical protein